MAAKKPQYRARVGINYPDPKKPGEEKRVEEGETVLDLPTRSIRELLEQRSIEEVI